MTAPELPWDAHPVWRSIDCGRGWWPLLLELDAELRQTDPGYTVVQVKEKFGGLRYYTSALSPAGMALVREAELRAARTCEVCGEPGTTVVRRHWYKTLCPPHAEGYLAGTPGWALQEDG